MLPNGIRVVTERMPKVRSVSVGIWVGTGSREEAEALGFTSLWVQEHLLFALNPKAPYAARPGMLVTVDVNWLNANFALSSSEKAFYVQLAGAVDQMNMMTYGMADAWSGWASWHSSALSGQG